MVSCAASCSKTCLFYSNRFEFVHYDLQYYFAHMVNQTNCVVVLTQLEVSFFGQDDDKILGPLSWPYPCSPNLIA